MKIQITHTSLQIKNQKWIEDSEKSFRFSHTESLLKLLINPFKLQTWEFLPFENCDGISDIAEFLFCHFDQGDENIKNAISEVMEFAEKDWKKSQKILSTGFLFQHAFENYLWAFDFQEDSAMRLFLERKLESTPLDSVAFEFFAELHKVFFSKGNTDVLIDFLAHK